MVGKDSIEIRKAETEDAWQKSAEELLLSSAKEYLLLLYEAPYQVQLMMLSGSPKLRAREFMEFLLAEFGLVKGDAKKSTGVISLPILKSKMADTETECIQSYFENKAAEYFTMTDCVESVEFARSQEAYIRNLPQYQKQKTKWAMVKSTDIVAPGQRFIVKSLENESGYSVTAQEDTYIMIGCRGEIYHIYADKFASTYDISDEKFDIFEEMVDYIPEVRIYPSGEYMGIDEIAKICYPKQDKRIYAKQLEKRTKVYPGDGTGEYFMGREGDFLVFRGDDIADSYIIQREVMERTYEMVEI